MEDVFGPLFGAAYGWLAFSGLAEYCRAERDRVAAGPVTAEMADTLREGRVVVHDASNALAPWCLAVNALVAKGMLAEAGRVGESQWDRGTAYAITDEGRAELERQRIADLAKIGVYEA